MKCLLVLFNASTAFILLVLPPMVSNETTCPYGYLKYKWGCDRAAFHGQQLPGKIIKAFGVENVVSRPTAKRKRYTLPAVTTHEPEIDEHSIPGLAVKPIITTSTTSPANTNDEDKIKVKTRGHAFYDEGSMEMGPRSKILEKSNKYWIFH